MPNKAKYSQLIQDATDATRFSFSVRRHASSTHVGEEEGNCNKVDTRCVRTDLGSATSASSPPNYLFTCASSRGSDALVEIKGILGTNPTAHDLRSVNLLDELAGYADSFSRARHKAKKLPAHMADTLDREGSYANPPPACACGVG